MYGISYGIDEEKETVGHAQCDAHLIETARVGRPLAVVDHGEHEEQIERQDAKPDRIRENVGHVQLGCSARCLIHRIFILRLSLEFTVIRAAVRFGGRL